MITSFECCASLFRCTRFHQHFAGSIIIPNKSRYNKILFSDLSSTLWKSIRVLIVDKVAYLHDGTNFLYRSLVLNDSRYTTTNSYSCLAQKSDRSWITASAYIARIAIRQEFEKFYSTVFAKGTFVYWWKHHSNETKMTTSYIAKSLLHLENVVDPKSVALLVTI